MEKLTDEEFPIKRRNNKVKPGPPSQNLGNRFTIQLTAADERLLKRVARTLKVSRGKLIRDIVAAQLPGMLEKGSA